CCLLSLCYSLLVSLLSISHFFFFNAPPPTAIYTLSLHDALPISVPFGGSGFEPARAVIRVLHRRRVRRFLREPQVDGHHQDAAGDRKSTRLNSSHDQISYAVFCLKKKKKKKTNI